MKIFIGSSSESKNDVWDIASIIEEYGHTPVKWFDDDVFIAGDYTIDKLTEIARNKTDAALFIFAFSDKRWYRDKTDFTVRDNVLLEYGIFCGLQSRNNVCIICKDTGNIATDLLGLTTIDYNKPNQARNKIVEWIKAISKDQIDVVNTYVVNDDILEKCSLYKRMLIEKASSGDVDSQCLLGYYYYVGDFVTGSDYSEAKKWIELAIKNGNVYALWILSRLYFKGVGVEKQSFRDSYDCLTRATELNTDVYRIYTHLGYIKRVGLNCNIDYEDSEKYYLKAVECNNNAYNHINHLYSQSGQYEKVLETICMMKTKGVRPNSESYLNAAKVYYFGLDGNNPDYIRAADYLKNSADGGNPEAEYMLGELYYLGHLGLDFRKAFEWYKKAALKGHPNSQYLLAHLYENGLGIEKNYIEAIKWYEKSAEQGGYYSQLSLGKLYLENIPPYAPNYERAFYWIQNIAIQGNSEAQQLLGTFYALGVGCEKEKAEAIKWYNIAKENGSMAAKYIIDNKDFPLYDLII